jgi:hypothetical protein
MSLAIDFSTNIFYLGTDYGVYSTRDAGTVWTHEAFHLPDVPIYDARVDVQNGFLVVATHGRGMWRAFLGAFVGPPPLVTNPATQQLRGRRPRVPEQPIP